MIQNWCNVNGELVLDTEAKVSVLDRGFLFGDSVYEVMRTRRGTPFTWQEHLDRMRRSAAGIGLEVDLPDAEIMRRVLATAAAARAETSPEDELYIRIIVTRGTGTQPNIDLAYAPGPATTVILARELPKVSGLPARIAMIPRLRNDRRALDPAVKSGNYLNNVLGLAEAKAAGATDCLFMNADGHATEASTANFYTVRDGALFTPPHAAGLLPGITRSMLQECAAEAVIEHHESDMTREDILASDEMFLSSTMRDVAPITHVDGKELHEGGAAGPFTVELMERFEAFCDRRIREVDGPNLTRLVES